MGVDSGALIKTLNKTCLNALQAAAGLCLSRTNPSVEVEHWLLKLAEAPDTDLTRIFRHFEVDPARLLRDLTQVIDQFRTGNQRTPTLSPADRPARSATPGCWPRSSTRRRRSARACCCWPCWTTRSWAGWRATPRASWPRSRSSVLQANLMKLVAGSAEDEGPRGRGRGRRRAGPADARPA